MSASEIRNPSGNKYQTKQRQKKGTGYWPNDFIYHPKIQLVHP